METILVGVDGSPGAHTAVEFAAREAAAHGAMVRILSAWEVPPSVLSGGGVPPDLYESFEAEARKLAEEAEALVHRLQPGVAVERMVVEGHAGNAIVDATADADLVVIGRRGHNRVAEFLLGSISHQVADHAHCPVVIVPWTKSED